LLFCADDFSKEMRDTDNWGIIEMFANANPQIVGLSHVKAGEEAGAEWRWSKQPINRSDFVHCI
jgi:hypothetical protein